MPSALSSQRVSWPPASQPTFGSERQNALSVDFAMSGRKRFFCSSLPKSMTALQPIDWCADTSTAVEPHERPRRSRTRL